MKIGKKLDVKDRRAWRAWLAKHHAKASEIWLVYWKKSSGKARIPYNDAVEEALCFGWIDSIVKPLNEHSWAQRFSPRKPKSQLSPMNRERVRRLINARKMTRAGLARIAHRFDHRADRKARAAWTLPKDIERRLKSDPIVWKNFQRFPKSYQHIRIGWIVGARKRRAAFEQRLRYFIRMTAENKRFGMVQ